MEKVEYKDTIIVEFITKRYNYNTELFETVIPTSYAAYLETYQYDPQQIVELTDISEIDFSTFWVNFYAHTDTSASIKPNQSYYVSFYWKHGGTKICERYQIKVVADV
jgi:hypothetical protein